jgi:hypothetical protein
MDLESVIIGAILLAIFIVPLIILNYNRVRNETKKLQSLTEFALQLNCEISQHEFCGDFIIGIDENRNFIFFLKQKKEDIISQFVDLSGCYSCQVYKKTRSLEGKNENVVILERVELRFFPTNKSKGETRFEMYDEETNMQLSGELQLIDKWSKKINDLLKNTKPVKYSLVGLP